MKYDLDIIMTAHSKGEELIKMTNNAIMSLRNSVGGDKFKIIVIEDNPDAEEYPEADVTVKPREIFKLNRFYNLGVKHSSSDYLMVINNDVLFEPDWWIHMKQAFMENNLDSACPQITNTQPDIFKIWVRQKNTFKNLDGYDWFFGPAWCVTGSVRDWLFPLDENILFYFSEFDLVQYFKQRNCKHQLVYKSKMQHFQHKSFHILHQAGRLQEVTWGSKGYIDQKWKKA